MDSRPPPPGPPPSYAFVGRVYKRSLRPMVLAVAFIAGIWSLASGIGFFRNAGIEKGVATIKIISIALGAVYMLVTGIEAFGVLAALRQNVSLARIYAFLSVLVTILILGIGITRTVIHFVFKDDLISSCADIANGQTVVFFGFWGPIAADTLDGPEALAWCRDSWNRGSWSEIVSLLATTVLAAFLTAIAFGFYRQLLDPTSAINVSRAPANQSRTETFPSHYNPPYNASGPGYVPAYEPRRQQYAPPPGPPPQADRDDPFAPPYDGKPPGYSNDGKPYMQRDDKDDPFDDDVAFNSHRF